MSVRRTVKVLLLDEEDRLLLLRGRESAGCEAIWYPVGGGIEDGEDAVAAGRREILEETGRREVVIGPEVWHRRHLYSWRGKQTDTDERWFVARTQHFTPTPYALTAEEQTYVTGSRWWRAEDLAATTDPVFPPDLGMHLASLLHNGFPATPINISALG
ncbi:NUDIX domain-containing protein [Kribbella pittospori]|uniref:NUDIX domain-containing protein n=1 Tax=Kribbella pittospori TaxID=722689 RepID=UPI0013F3BBE5|nr:NUDIX domain-containing protein [Kribbella pittospori]